MLYPFQTEGARWLTENRFRLLADEMGLGKSAQAIVACDRVEADRVLVIGPAVSRRNWRKEFELWSKRPRKFQVLESSKDRLFPGFSAICSFEYATRHVELLTANGDWDAVIIDEVHYLKSIDAKRSKAILGKGGIVHHTKRVWVLSGTPAPNHAGELWTLLYVFGVIKMNQFAFIERYCDTVDTGYGRQVVGTKRSMIPELRKLLSKVMLRREKEQVLTELPPIAFGEVTVEPGEVEIDDGLFEEALTVAGPAGFREELNRRLKEERELLAEKLRGPDEMAQLEGMAKSVSTLRRYTGLQKVDPVIELVAEELSAGLYEKIVVFAIHRSVIALLEKKWRERGFRVVSIHGGTAPSARQKAIESFQSQEPKSAQIFIGQIQAAGTNITLTQAHHVLFLEQDWVPGNNAQAAMRCHRIGQNRNVDVRFVQLDHPLDARVTQIVKRKTRELAQIFDC